jgi:glycosyltransferase involved in cell wall biosynthesis
MKVTIVNTHEKAGGAATAANRMFRCMENANLNTNYLVNNKISNSSNIHGNNQIIKIYFKAVNKILKLINKSFISTGEKSIKSFNIFPSNTLSRINKTNPDITFLHWVNEEFIPIYNIKKIKGKVVWILHDMWLFSSIDHYSQDDNNLSRFGKIISKYIYNFKRNNLPKDLTIIAPSQWMAKEAEKSEILKDFSIHTIPNPIDTNVWKPFSKQSAKDELNINTNKKLILFGADGGGKDPRKGFDLLVKAIKNLNNHTELALVVFGSDKTKTELPKEFETFFLGKIDNIEKLILAYSAADILAIPSRKDNLPNMIIEAFACNTPAVAFNIGGISDIIDHKKNGYLALPFDTDDFAKGISWLLDSDNDELGKSARNKCVENYSFEVISKVYIEFIKNQKL